jgi:hypothetical protein
MRSEALPRPTPEPPLERWFDATTLRPAGRGASPEVCPPRLARSRPWQTIVREWLTAGWPRRAEPAQAPRLTPALEAIRQEFIDAVEGTHAPAADDLLDRIHFARSLRELWHLRAEVFRLVALHRSQSEADARLAALNRHFPTRSPRSGFGPLHPHPTKDMWP